MPITQVPLVLPDFVKSVSSFSKTVFTDLGDPYNDNNNNNNDDDDPDWVSNGKQAARKMFPRRSKDQKSTPVNVSTYSTQRRDKEKR